MKHLSRLLLVVLYLGYTTAFAAPAAEKTDTARVIKALRSEIAARPSRVLIAVEDALTVNEQCACEIVKEAIEATRADAELVGQIVLTALKSAPGMSATIVECAVEAAPHAAQEIRLAMHEALGDNATKTGEDSAEASSETPAKEAEAGAKETEGRGKESAGSGKELVPSGKTVTAVAAVESETVESETGEWFDTFKIGVGGIYLTTPGTSWIRRCDPRDHCCGGTDLSPACLRP